jgi:hypothetical protein
MFPPGYYRCPDGGIYLNLENQRRLFPNMEVWTAHTVAMGRDMPAMVQLTPSDCADFIASTKEGPIMSPNDDINYVKKMLQISQVATQVLEQPQQQQPQQQRDIQGAVQNLMRDKTSFKQLYTAIPPEFSCPMIGGNAQHKYRVAIGLSGIMENLAPNEKITEQQQKILERYPVLFSHAQDMGCVAAGGKFNMADSTCEMPVCAITQEQAQECMAYTSGVSVDGGEFVRGEFGLCMPAQSFMQQVLKDAPPIANDTELAMSALDRVESRLKDQGMSVAGGGGYCMIM